MPRPLDGGLPQQIHVLATELAHQRIERTILTSPLGRAEAFVAVRSITMATSDFMHRCLPA